MNEAELAGWLFQVRNDPLRFALEAFPWGEPGTPLEDESLRPWQMEFLRDLGGHLRDRNYNGRDPVRPVRMAAVSGHGVGKSALSAILLLFLHHTRPGGSGTVTASTAEQLYDKTFKELGKWHGMSLCRDLSVYSRSKQNMHLHAEEDPSWGLRGVTSSKENATAIQGQHSKGSTSFYLVDEASGVPDEIFQACYGGMAVSEGVFIMFGNGIKATGEFHKAFHGSRSLWDARSVSCLDVFGMDHPYSRDIIDEYGMDHDVTRVRVLGQFPNQAENQFIGFDDIKGSQGCRFPPEPEDPLILGVDVAMGGGDSSVIYPLRGRDATGEPEIVRNTNLMSLAMQVARRIDRDDARYVYIDETGLGRGVVDRLHQMGYFMVEGVNFASKAPEPGFANIRAWMYWRLKRRIEERQIQLPDMRMLREELGAQLYKYRSSDNAIQLEPKTVIKGNLGRSCDLSDALALTMMAFPFKGGMMKPYMALGARNRKAR